MDAKTVSGEIIRQLGGVGKLRAMVAADNFVYSVMGDNTTLSFSFRGSKKFNAIRITYVAAQDLYDVKFIRVGKKDGVMCFTANSGFECVYFDQLKGLFESETGLRLSL